MNWYEKRGKRATDLVISIILIIALSPVMFSLMIAIIIIDRHNPILSQKRIGYKGKPFKLYKFRTMQKSPDNKPLTDPDDFRVTKFGKLFRKYSLDELPQLFNVLNGTMSIVGPRPEISENFKLYPAGVERRFRAKPGITGLAQVNGRNLLSFNEVLKYDVDYSKNITLVTDLKVLLRTLPAVLSSRGAY